MNLGGLHPLRWVGRLIFFRTLDAEALAQSPYVPEVLLAKLVAGVGFHELVRRDAVSQHSSKPTRPSDSVASQGAAS